MSDEDINPQQALPRNKIAGAIRAATFASGSKGALAAHIAKYHGLNERTVDSIIKNPEYEISRMQHKTGADAQKHALRIAMILDALDFPDHEEPWLTFRQLCEDRGVDFSTVLKSTDKA